jgi:hypothetical protein
VVWYSEAYNEKNIRKMEEEEVKEMNLLVIFFFAICLNTDCGILLKKKEGSNLLGMVKISLAVEIILWFLAFLACEEELTFQFYLGALLVILATASIERYLQNVKEMLWSPKLHYFLFLSSPILLLLLIFTNGSVFF